MSFFEYKNDDRLYFKSTVIENNTTTVHAFTTKLGGKSHGFIEGFNLGFRVNDDRASVLENYRLLAQDLGVNFNRIVPSKQTHSSNIRIVTEADCGKGIVRDNNIENTDGLVTSIPNIPLIVYAADCVPILLCDKGGKAVAAVHAGWRGTVADIAVKCVDIMKSQFDCNPIDICAAIGPSISKCCFEFGSDAVIYFDKKYYTKLSDDKYLVDLQTYNRDRLTDAGVLPSNIDISGICTMCNGDMFYSYRRDRERTGRQGALIMLKD